MSLGKVKRSSDRRSFLQPSPLTGPGPVAAALSTTTALLITMALGTYIRLWPASSVVNRKLISTDAALEGGHGDAVVLLERLVDDDHDAGKHVGDDLLQRQADRQAGQAQAGHQGADVDAQRPQGDDAADGEDAAADDFAEEVQQAGLDFPQAAQPLDAPAGPVAGQPGDGHDNRRDGQPRQEQQNGIERSLAEPLRWPCEGSLGRGLNRTPHTPCAVQSATAVPDTLLTKRPVRGTVRAALAGVVALLVDPR